MSDKEFWEGVEGSYRRLRYFGLTLAGVAALAAAHATIWSMLQ